MTAFRKKRWNKKAFGQTKRRESTVEQWSRTYATKEAYQLTKFEVHVGDADNILTGIAIAPAVVFVEFKTTEKHSKLSDAQSDTGKALKKRGYPYYVIRTKDEFKSLIIHLDKHGVTKKWKRKKT